MCDKEANNLINQPLLQIKEEQIKENKGYNCSVCSSLIEILSINENELEFNCVNNKNHSNKLKIVNYLEKMKKYLDNKNLIQVCEKHNNNEYILYCFDCKYHLCKECLKSKIHFNHNKKNIYEPQPSDEDINSIKNIIKNYNNELINLKQEKENKIKELKTELNTNKINENKRTRKILKVNRYNKEKELKTNEERYINDIKEIKMKYEKEIKLRKIKYEKENNKINNKYKLMLNREILINKNKIKE